MRRTTWPHQACVQSGTSSPTRKLASLADRACDALARHGRSKSMSSTHASLMLADAIGLISRFVHECFGPCSPDSSSVDGLPPRRATKARQQARRGTGGAARSRRRLRHLPVTSRPAGGEPVANPSTGRRHTEPQQTNQGDKNAGTHGNLLSRPLAGRSFDIGELSAERPMLWSARSPLMSPCFERPGWT